METLKKNSIPMQSRSLILLGGFAVAATLIVFIWLFFFPNDQAQTLVPANGNAQAPSAGASILDQIFDALPTILGIGLIIWGTVVIDRIIVGQERAQGNDNTRLLFVLRSVIVLSAVSFATTLFGMLNFVEGSRSALGGEIVGWFISLGTTFGIQFIMLVISLELGERLVNLRPRVDDHLHQNMLNSRAVHQSRREGARKLLWLTLAAFCFAVSAVGLQLVSLADLQRWVQGLLNGQSSPQFILGAFFFLFGLVALRLGNIVAGLWNPVTLIFLLFVYGGTLAVSSLFSFDSYYSLFRTQEDVETSRTAIVQERTSEIRNTLARSLSDHLATLPNQAPVVANFNEVSEGIDNLQAKARQLAERFKQDAVSAERLREEEVQRLERLKRTAETRYQEERNRILSVLGEVEGVRAQVAQAETRVATLAGEREAAENRVKALRDNAERNLILARCEEEGLVDGICEGTSGTPSCGTKCEGFKNNARTLNFQADEAEKRVEAISADEAEAASALKNLRTQLQTITTEFEAGDEGEETPVQRRLKAAEEAYNTELERIDALIANVPVSARQSTGDVSAISTSFSKFRTNLTGETFGEFTGTCSGTRDGLIRIGADDTEIRAFECQPVVLANLATEMDRTREAQAQFQANCSNNFQVNTAADAPAKKSAEAIVQATRDCIAIADLGQPGVAKEAQALTSMESTYLSNSSSLRRSIADLGRRDIFATGAAAAAVFIDMLILVVGMLIAMNRPSPLYDNPLDPEVAEVERLILDTARFYAPDGEAATGLRRFVQYLENRDVEALDEFEGPEAIFYRATIDETAVVPADKQLVSKIKNIIPPRYQKIVNYKPQGAIAGQAMERRVSINQTIVAFMMRAAHSVAPPKRQGSALGAAFIDRDPSGLDRLIEERQKARGSSAPRKSPKEPNGPAPKASPQNLDN